jgi:hypothetical protein
MNVKGHSHRFNAHDDCLLRRVIFSYDPEHLICRVKACQSQRILRQVARTIENIFQFEEMRCRPSNDNDATALMPVLGFGEWGYLCGVLPEILSLLLQRVGTVHRFLRCYLYFDKDLYISLMKGIDRYDPRVSFDYLTGFSFVWDSEERGEGWYRIHDLMRHPTSRLRSSFATKLPSESEQCTSRSRSRLDGIDDAAHRKREVPPCAQHSGPAAYSA